MALGINRKLKPRLIEAAAAAVRKAIVLSGCVVSQSSIAEARGDLLPENGPLVDKLRTLIGDRPWDVFVAGELTDLFAPHAKYQQDEKRALTDYPGFEDPESVGREIVERFESLPWRYCLICRLPDALRDAVSERPVELSPQHRIELGDRLRRNIPQAEPAAGLAGLMRGIGTSNDIDAGGVYLQVSMTGYVSGAATEPFQAARDDVLAFLGMCISLRLLLPSHYFENTKRFTNYLLYRERTVGWDSVGPIPINERHGRVIDGMQPWHIGDTQELRSALERIGVIFRGRALRPLELAARWLLESYAGDDDLLRYIQVVVAAEVLLGDEKKNREVGLTALMANRCAYLLAKTPAARADLMRMFTEAYDVRSRIVHRGKSRLNRKEMQYFHMLQTICEQLLRSELELVERAERMEVTRLSLSDG